MDPPSSSCAGTASLAGWTLHEIRIGFRPLADDNRPMLGPVPGVDNLLIGNGLGPSGLTIGPYAAYAPLRERLSVVDSRLRGNDVTPGSAPWRF